MSEKKFYYSHGLPFTTFLVSNLENIRRRIEENKAAMILVDGGVGEGKTTLCVHMADFLQGAYTRQGEKWIKDKSKQIDLEKQIGMGGEQFVLKLKLCYREKLAVVIYDEAGDFDKRGALSRFNALINRVFDTFRTFHVIVIAALPCFAVLDEPIFTKKIPRMLINCRGRTKLSGEFYGYSLYRMQYIKHKMKKLIVRSRAYYQTSPNFKGHFLDLEPDRSATLDRLSTAGKMSILEGAEVSAGDYLTVRDIAEKVGRSIISIQKYLKELQVRPDMIRANTHYYKGPIVDIIANHVAKMDKKMIGPKQFYGKTATELMIQPDLEGLEPGADDAEAGE